MAKPLSFQKTFVLFKTLQEAARRGLARWFFPYSDPGRLRPYLPPSLSFPWRIVRYQRVINPEAVMLPLPATDFVRPDTLRMHLQYLKRYCHIVPLDELAGKLYRGEKIEWGTVAITFDGGWVDNYSQALPILNSYDIPATFFLPTAFIGTENRFWPDKVTAALMTIKAYGKKMPDFSEADERARAMIHVAAADGTITLENIGFTVAVLKTLPPEERVPFFSELGKITSDLGGSIAERTFMNWEEVKEMKSKGMSFGSLSHNHLEWDEVEKETALQDLQASMHALLEHELNPTFIYAFPHGVVPLHGPRALAEFRLPFGLSASPEPIPPLQDDAVILPRVPVWEFNASSEALFGCRLWGVNWFGLQY